MPAIAEENSFETIWNFTISPFTGFSTGSYWEASAATICFAWAWLPVYGEIYFIISKRLVRFATEQGLDVGALRVLDTANLVVDADKARYDLDEYYGHALKPEQFVAVACWFIWVSIMKICRMPIR